MISSIYDHNSTLESKDIGKIKEAVMFNTIVINALSKLIFKYDS